MLDLTSAIMDISRQPDTYQEIKYCKAIYQDRLHDAKYKLFMQ